MTTTTKPLVNLAILDTALLAVACLVPAASHLLAVPLYMLNPMLAVLLVGMLIGRDWRNSLVLALLLPLVSYLVVGMPTAPKMLCMMAEMVTLVSLFTVLVKRWAVLPAVLAAVMAGKVVYYLLKMVVMAPVMIISTDWKVQVAVVLLWGGVFALLYKREK